MTEKAVELIKKGRSKEAILGCAFYHRQDAQRRDEGHDFHISYGPMESKEFDMIGRSAKEVGHIVCKALLKHEIKFEWDGNPDTRILIKAGSWQ